MTRRFSRSRGPMLMAAESSVGIDSSTSTSRNRRNGLACGDVLACTNADDAQVAGGWRAHGNEGFRRRNRWRSFAALLGDRARLRLLGAFAEALQTLLRD